MTDTVLSIVVLVALALVWGAVVLWRRGERTKAALMVLLAAVMAGNVAIWTLPDASGSAPLGRELR